MITISIPGFGDLALAHLVLDYNGTIALDGRPIYGVIPRLQALARVLQIHVLTADTFGAVQSELAGVPCRLHILPAGEQDRGKAEYVESLGRGQTVAVGNGRNDGLMLKSAALGIAVVLGEGGAVATLQAADICCTDILAALDLLTHPLRLTATLRS